MASSVKVDTGKSQLLQPDMILARDRLAAALDLPLYRLFYTTGEESSTASTVTARKSLEELAEDTGPIGSEARFVLTLKGYVDRMTESDRTMLLDLAKKLAAR